MRPKGSAAELEARRRRAAALLEDGWGVRAVAREVGSSPSSVTRWKQQVERGGTQALAAKPSAGRPPRLSARQKKKLLQLLLKGATAHGYGSQLWTLPRVAELIEKHFDIRYHPAHVCRILHACGGEALRTRDGKESARDKGREKEDPARRTLELAREGAAPYFWRDPGLGDLTSGLEPGGQPKARTRSRVQWLRG